jgi:hypothetical protein
LVWKRRCHTATAKTKYRDLSTTAAKAPPPVEMTDLWVGRSEQTTATATTEADPYGMTNRRAKA